MVFSTVHSRRMGAGHASGVVFGVCSTGSWVKGRFEDGQDRGRKIIEELIGTVEDESLDPSRRQGVGDYLVSG